MANLLKGKPVAEALNEKSIEEVKALEEKGIHPTLAIVRVGEKEEDISYEKGALKRCAEVGVQVKQVLLPEDVDYDLFYQTMDELNKDKEVHGILMFRPVPVHLDKEKARLSIAPEKDVDGCTDESLSGLFTGDKKGFPPCTAQAVIELCDYYNIDLTGKNVAIFGRSLVIGRPVAMLMMERNATITITHTKTVDEASISRNADIVVSAMGVLRHMTKDYFVEGQTVIDVGINYDEKLQKLCGDVDFDEVEPIVDSITPVPGGVGAITTSVLVKHVIEAAKQQNS